ncbi:MAG: aminodeoxychorismate synthase component I [Planctomycetota bacterium]
MNFYSHFYNRPYPFYLTSAMRHKTWGKFSFIGSDPFLILKSKGNNITIEQDGKITHKKGDPLEELRSILNTYKVRHNPKSPAPFMGGGVGYFGYDLCHFIEKLPSTTKNDLKFPDLFFAFYDKFIAIDHSANKAWNVRLDIGANLCSLDSCLRRNDTFLSVIPAKAGIQKKKITGSMLKSNFTKQEYLKAVRRVKEYIFAGDIYQANLSQRFEIPLNKHPLELFQILQQINPAPFSALLKPNNNKLIISSSPERFLKVKNGYIETRPIKGTRPRGQTKQQDSRLKKELFHSIKDNAELAMIVDMERNDLGRVCKYDSVKVTQQKVLETYPTLHHLVATVKGELDSKYDLVDVVKATFPGGSITGAPKIRAMEIIDELEPTRRNVYTGAIGYIGFDGTMDLSIAIRIIMLNGNKAYYQVGGGIVADSDPASEYQETLTKGKALMQACLI